MASRRIVDTQAGRRRALQLTLCAELTELGMTLVREVAARAAGPDATPDDAMIFSRLAHEVQQAIMLEQRLAADPLPAARHKS